MPVHLIKAGDTTNRIAGRYGIPERWLYKANDYFDFDDFRPGRRIYIPDYEYDYYDYPKEWGRHKYHEGIRYDLRTGRKRFRPGENVSIIFSYCNLSDKPKRLRYDDARLYDFKCLRGGKDIWRWSEKNKYAHGRQTMLLKPGECRTFHGDWDFCERTGSRVKPGAYVLRAYDRSRELRDKYVDIGVEMFNPKKQDNITIPGKDTCSQSNMLFNPDLDNWTSSNTPTGWSAQNLSRSIRRQTGRYAAELGTRPLDQALLAQVIGAAPRRSYQVTFWAMEASSGVNQSNFDLEVTVHPLDQQSRQIGRLGPVFRPAQLPGDAYKRYSFTTELLPSGAGGMQLRFIFRPRSGNTNKVRVDDVELTCLK